jgi:S-adenosylmethionine decarboxylase
MIVGTEWLVDASGCSPSILRDGEALRRLFDCIIAELDLQVLGEQMWHQFPPPGGITGLALLTESHLACHTYPEFQTATFNLYCCRERPEWPWAARLKEMLGAESVSVRVVHRLVPDEQIGAGEQLMKTELSKPSITGGEW